jgi:ferric-dicitrate binding protein FerR (iron transport regulator)
VALRRGLDESERFTHSELRQRRVWARVSDPARTFRDTRRAFMRGALIASAVTAGAVFVVQRVQDEGRGGAAVELARGDVKPSGGASVKAAPMGVAAAAGTVVETQPGERLVRLLPRGARAELAPRTSMAVDGEGRPELRHGEVRFSVAKVDHAKNDARVFSLRVASYRVVVAGARFVVKAQAQAISVAVEDGVAEIWNGSHVVRIGSGETWTSEGADEARGSARAGARTGAPRATHERTPALAPAAAASTEEDLRDREDLAAARAARAASDPRRALALYEQLATHSGPTAENAMYEIGGIYHDQLKQPAKAIAAWDRYRTRFPHGLLRAEADLSVIDTLATLDTPGSADAGMRTLNEALAFLKRYPHSERRGEVARVAGDIYRGRKDCRAALDFYRAALNAKVAPEDADDASFGQAACLYELRDEGAAAALRAYLNGNPRGRHARDASRLLGDKGTP